MLIGSPGKDFCSLFRSGVVLRAITRAISLSALVGRTVTGMLLNLLQTSSCGLYIDASCGEVVPATAYLPIPMIRPIGYVLGTVLQRLLDNFARLGRPCIVRRDCN